MGCKVSAIGVLMLLWCTTLATGAIECNQVGSLMSFCSTFLTFGAPEPDPNTPCCKALLSLKIMVATILDRKDVCKCLVAFMNIYHPNQRAVERLPILCGGIYLGFFADPNFDCNSIL